MNIKMMDQLEPLVDQSSVAEVVEALAEVCWAKSEHIRSNWQDEQLAICWERCGNQLSGMQAKIGIYGRAPGIIALNESDGQIEFSGWTEVQA